MLPKVAKARTYSVTVAGIFDKITLPIRVSEFAEIYIYSILNKIAGKKFWPKFCEIFKNFE